MELGVIQPTEAETVAWAEKIVATRRRAIHGGQLPAPRNVEGLPPARKPKFGNFPARFEDYLAGVKSRSQIVRSCERGVVPNGFQGSSVHLALNWRSAYSPDSKGYLTYLNDYFDDIGSGAGFHDWMQKVPAPSLDEKVRESHTSIVAGTGAGKSELMKALAYHDIRRGKAAVVIIDPHGTMAAEIARWPEVAKSGRLVWLSSPHEGMSARFNPLDGRGLSASDKGKVAELLVSNLGDLVENTSPTPRMHTLAVMCVRVLLEHDGATLFDLADFLTPTKWAPWVERGKKHPSQGVARYFRDEFTGESKEVSHTGMKDRLWNLLRSDEFTARFCQPSTFDLLAEIEARKVIILDLKEMMPEVRRVAGRLVLGTMAGIGMRRIAGQLSASVPVHVYVDEARTLVGKAALSIITDTRKAGIHLTMAQQSEGAQTPEARSILQTTAVKFASGEAWKSVFVKGDLGAGDTKGDKNTKRGCFWVRWGNDHAPFLLAVRNDLARRQDGSFDPAHYISKKEWQRVKHDQFSRYYRPLEGLNEGHDGGGSTPKAEKRQSKPFKVPD